MGASPWPGATRTFVVAVFVYEFFGVDHMTPATDSPSDDECGARVYPETISAVQAMPKPEAEKRQLEDNARRLFRIDA